MSTFDESVARLRMSRGVPDGFIVAGKSALELYDRMGRNLKRLEGLKVTLGQKDTGEPEVWLSLILDFSSGEVTAQETLDCEPLDVSHPCGPPPFPPC